jgi:hypothetical protein
MLYRRQNRLMREIDRPWLRARLLRQLVGSGLSWSGQSGRVYEFRECFLESEYVCGIDVSVLPLGIPSLA